MLISDFGIVLGCKYYIKEITNRKLAEKDPGLREGDTVLRINGQSVDGVTIEEATKWLLRSREKLSLVVQRDVRRGTSRQVAYFCCRLVSRSLLPPPPPHSLLWRGVPSLFMHLHFLSSFLSLCFLAAVDVLIAKVWWSINLAGVGLSENNFCHQSFKIFSCIPSVEENVLEF